MQNSKPINTSELLICPDEDLMLQSTKALYRKIDQLNFVIEQQTQQLQSLSTELLLRGHWKPMEFVSELLGFCHSHYMVILYDFQKAVLQDHSENPQMAELKQKIYSIFQACFSSEYPSHSCESDTGINTILMNIPELTPPNGNAIENELIMSMRNFMDQVETSLHIHLSACMSRCCDNLNQLPQALQEVQRLNKLQHSMQVCNRILYIPRLQLDPQTEDISDEALETSLALAIAGQDIPTLHRAFNQIVLKNRKTSDNLSDLLPLVDRRLEKLHESMRLNKQHLSILLNAQTSLHNVHSIDELLIVINDYFSEIDNLPQSDINKDFTSHELLASDIMNYIDKHFTDSQIGNTMLAGYFHVDSTRISKVFKTVYGLGPTKYIQKKRVEYAAELISTSTKTINTIMLESGFTNRRTFDRVFEQHTGCTPTQYRQK